MNHPGAPKLAWARARDLAARVIRGFIFLAGLGAAGAAWAQAPAGSMGITSGRSVLDLATGETVFTGNPKIQDEGLQLEAEEIRVNVKTGMASATSKVVLTLLPANIAPQRVNPSEGIGAIRLLADHVAYDQARRFFRADNIRIGGHPVFIEGFSASGTMDQIVIERARGNFGEPSKWQPTFFADRLILEPGRQIRTERALLGIGEVRPIPLSGFEHDLTQPFPVTMALNGGFRNALGAFAEVDLHLPVTRGVRLGADIGGYTRRGVMAGPSGRYARPRRPDELSGYFHSGYINDYGNREIDLLGRPVPQDRAYFEWQHRQQFGDDVALRAQLNWWMDSEVLRDFRPRSFYPVQAPDTFAEATHAGANYFLSAFTRLQPNTFQSVQERLPEIRFDLLPTAIGLGLYERFNASAAVLREDPPMGGPRLRSDRLDAYYTLFRPTLPAEWLTVTPVAGGRVTHYANTVGAVRNGSYTRLLGELGLDAEIRSSGVFNYRNELWKIDGLRHLFTPKVSYRYIPEGERGRARIPRIDRNVFSTYLPPLGLGDQRQIDDLHATNSLRLGFDNTLQTRDPVHGSRDLVVLNLANDFRFKRRPGERDVSEVQAEVTLTPASWLQVDAFQSMSPSNLTLREFNSGVTLRDGSAWSLRFANNYLRRDLEDYFIDGRVRINEAFEGLLRLRYDARRRRFNEQSYGLVHNIANTWRVSYTVSLYSGRRRESGVGFNVQIDTVRF